MLLFTVAVVISARAEAFEFIPLGDLPGGAYFSRPTDISADGSIVVGGSRSGGVTAGLGCGADCSEAFRWTRGTGIVGLGDLAGGAFNSIANAISEDGTTIIGTAFGTSGSAAVSWTEADGLVSLFSQSAAALGVSPDGKVIVGAAGDIPEAVRWTAEEGVQVLALPYPGVWSGAEARGVSASGSVIVGTSSLSPTYYASIWRGDAAADFFLVDIAQDGQYDSAMAVTRDGRVVVGTRKLPQQFEAYRWTDSVGVELLGYPFDTDEFGEVYSVANDVSADGRRIVGYGEIVGASAQKRAALWEESKGWSFVDDLLISAGVDLSGWRLTEATAISADGRYVVGVGFNPAGDQEGWIAAITPEPSTTTLVAGLVVSWPVRRPRPGIARR